MRYRAWTLLGVLLLVVLGCGGGGTTSKPDKSIQFTVIAGQQSSGINGDVTVTASSQAYSTSSTVTLTLHSQLQNPPANDRVKIDGPMLSIESTSEPSQPLLASCPIAVTKTPRIVLLRDVDRWVTVPFQTNGSTIQFELTVASRSRSSSSRGFGSTWQAIVGWFKEVAGIEQLGLTRIAGTGELGNGSLVLIHGIGDSKDSMKPLADQMLRQYSGYKNAWSLGYNWKESTDGGVAAQFLADQLNATGAIKSIDIVGQSRGVLLGRYALEKLGATKPVRRTFWLNGPNLGSRFGNPMDVVYGFTSGIVNLGSSLAQGISLPRGDEPALVELVWDSNFTNTLNQANYAQRGNVDYYFLHAASDNVVARNSAWAENVSIATLTEGRIERIEISGEHGSVLKDVSAMNSFISQAFPLFEEEIGISAFPNPNQAFWDGWEQTMTVVNLTSEQIELYDLSIDHYDREGTWGSRQWWSPSWSGTFPAEYQLFSIRLQPGENYELTTNTGRDGTDLSNWNPLWQAQTGIYTVRAKGLTTGHDYDDRVEVEKFSSYGHPATAQTRAPHGPARPGPKDSGRKN